MELDELKKTWTAMDRHLQDKSVVDENRIAELIANHKKNIENGQQRLSLMLKISLCGGGVVLVGAVLLTVLGHLSTNFAVLLAFVIASIVGGLYWDWRTYHWMASARMDEMTVAEASRRMLDFRRRMACEVRIVAVWAVLWSALFYWSSGYYLFPVAKQLLLAALLLLADVLVIYFLYKHMVYQHLDNIKKNIEELKDICIESH